MKRSKKYQAASKLVKKGNAYKVSEAAALLPKVSTSKFAGTVELTVFFRLNEKQKKETIRGTYSLPHSFGKEVRVLLFADPSYKSEGSKADIVGGEELIKDVEEGKLQFDAVVAMPAMMPKIARLGRTLGSKGLMPNPKNGTVSEDPDKAIVKLKSGQRNYKLDDAMTIKAVVGKTDMKTEELQANIKAFAAIAATEIAKFGAHTVRKVTVSPSMGPVILLDSSDFLA